MRQLMLPDVRGRIPAQASSRVVLPEPFGPTRATTSASLRWKSTLFRTVREPRWTSMPDACSKVP